MNDTTRRFLSAIVERVPAGGEIVELRLFPAIRQGGIESGVAVVAVQLPVAAPSVDVEVAVDAGAPPHAGVVPISPALHDLVDTDVAVEDEEGSDGDEHPVAVSFIPMADTTGEFEVADALDAELTEIVVAVERDTVAASERATTPPSGNDELDSPYADASLPSEDSGRPIPVVQADSATGDVAVLADLADLADLGAPSEESPMPLADILALPSPEGRAGDDVAETPVVPRQRYAILTARYRLTFKGPDRGKWDVEITHEADAPLDTVERVARGVAKRAGDASDPEHFSGESLRAALEAPVWATTP